MLALDNWAPSGEKTISRIAFLGPFSVETCLPVLASQIVIELSLFAPAANFPSEFDYGLVVYARTAVWMHLMEKTIGKEDFEKGIQTYFANWKFKHPYPEDLQTSMESVTHSSMTKLFSLLHSNLQL